MTSQSFAYIILLLAQLQWEGLTNVMTLIQQIRQRVCKKRENNPRQSIEGKMLTIPQVLWKSITNPALHPLTLNTPNHNVQSINN